MLLFSMAAQFGNALFAGHVNLFLKHVARCTSATEARLCLGAWCLLPSVAPPQQRTIVVVAFYVAAFTFGPALLAKARKHGVVRVLSVEFACYGATLLCTPVLVCAIMSALGAPVFSEPVVPVDAQRHQASIILGNIWSALHRPLGGGGSGMEDEGAPLAVPARLAAHSAAHGGGSGSGSEAGFWSMLVCSFLIGTAGSGISVLPDLIIAMRVDKDEAACGRNRSGAFYGARQVSLRSLHRHHCHRHRLELRCTRCCGGDFAVLKRGMGASDLHARARARTHTHRCAFAWGRRLRPRPPGSLSCVCSV